MTEKVHKLRLPCKFCNRMYTVLMNYRQMQHINCQSCLIDFTYTDDKITRIEYRLKHPLYKYISMDLIENKTFLGLYPKQKKYKRGTYYFGFEGTWPDTLPSDALKLAERLEALLVFS